MQTLFSKKDYLNNMLNKSVLAEKGKFDCLFLFISEYLCHSYNSGIFLNKEGIGNIIIPETKAIDLFYSYYVASQDFYPIDIMEIIIEAEYIKIINNNNNLTENEMLELVLMKQLLLALYVVDIEKINSLTSAFCSSETRYTVSLLISKIKEYQ